MRLLSGLFVLVMLQVFSIGVFAQEGSSSIDSIIREAELLAEQKKYASAFNLLEQQDPNNTSIEAVLLKEELCIKYFVTSIGHQMFSFMDIEPEEDILDYRGIEGTSSLHFFAVNEILDSLVEVYPDDCRLFKGLGDFYYDVHLRYGSNWVMSEEEMFEKMRSGYEKVLDSPCEDYMTSYVLGYLALLENDLVTCIPFFERSIGLDASYPSSHYNLAYAYLFSEDLNSALKYAINSLNLYEDQTYKGDAARLAGQVCLALNRLDESLDYFNQSDVIDPGNYYTVSSIIGVYLKTGDARSLEKSEDLFRLGPDDFDMYGLLEQVYFEYERMGDLEDLYKKMLKEYKDDDMVCGTIYFMTASHYIEKDGKKVVENCKKARERFIKVFPVDHPAIITIDETIREYADK